jgi:hypothetical protein
MLPAFVHVQASEHVMVVVHARSCAIHPDTGEVCAVLVLCSCEHVASILVPLYLCSIHPDTGEVCAVLVLCSRLALILVPMYLCCIHFGTVVVWRHRERKRALHHAATAPVVQEPCAPGSHMHMLYNNPMHHAATCVCETNSPGWQDGPQRPHNSSAFV